MTYFNSNNLAGVIVDGVPDSVTPHFPALDRNLDTVFTA